jgi:hypothetical protein
MNRKNMIEATLSYLDEHAEKWQGIAKLVTVKTQLSQVNQAIDVAAKNKADASVTIGKTKLALKKTIALKADILNDIVEVYATMQGNDELARQMGDSQTTLWRMKYADLIMRVMQIIEKAEELKDVLIAEYGMTEEQVTDLQNDMNQMLEINGQPRAYLIKHVVATKELEQLFGDGMGLLESMDKLMSIFKKRDVNFHNGYEKARMIVDY